MIGVPAPAICTGSPLPPRHLETDRLEETEALASHLERRVATETSIPDVGVPGGGYLLPPGTAKRLRRSPSGDDRARWKAGKGIIRRLWPRPFTWNGGRQQKRPFQMSEFQVAAFCFHPERPIGTGSPPTATTVPGGRTERNKGSDGPLAATTVPGGKPRKQ